MFYILNFDYSPNTAVNNRLLGYYHALDQLGVEATVVYLHPNNDYDRLEHQYQNIKVVYCWKKWLPYRGPFRKLTLKKYINRFVSSLKLGDVVYTYSISKLTSVCQHIDGVRVFAERTEHPDISNGFRHLLLSLTKDEYNTTVKDLDGLFVISEPLKDYYSAIGLDKSRIEIVNMIVDDSRFDGIQKTQVKERYIAYCGTLSNNKDGVDELIKAFGIVAKQIPDVKLYIIGKISETKDKSSNLELIKQLGIKNRVVFTGLVKAEDMPQLLKNAEIMALDRPDNLQAKYGFPTKLGEYLLTENPVVVTAVGDIPKFLKDGESALLAKPNDALDFSSKLLWALTHKEEASRIGRVGAAVAKKYFNSVLEIKKMLNHIQKQ